MGACLALENSVARQRDRNPMIHQLSFRQESRWHAKRTPTHPEHSTTFTHFRAFNSWTPKWLTNRDVGVHLGRKSVISIALVTFCFWWSLGGSDYFGPVAQNGRVVVLFGRFKNCLKLLIKATSFKGHGNRFESKLSMDEHCSLSKSGQRR